MSSVRAKFSTARQEQNQAEASNVIPLMIKYTQSSESFLIVLEEEEAGQEDKGKKRMFEDEGTPFHVPHFRAIKPDDEWIASGNEMISLYAQDVPYDFSYKECPRYGARAVGMMNEAMVGFAYASDMTSSYLEAAEQGLVNATKKTHLLEAELANEKSNPATALTRDDELKKGIVSFDIQVRSLDDENERLDKAHEEALAGPEEASTIWFVKGRIATMQELEEQRKKWDVASDIADFREMYPHKSLEDLGVALQDKAEERTSKTAEIAQPENVANEDKDTPAQLTFSLSFEGNASG